MGLQTWQHASTLSASRYVTVSYEAKTDEETDHMVKVRVSDHDDRYGGSDLWAWAGECPSQVISQIADEFECEVPARYTAEAFQRRRDAARKAAANRKPTASQVSGERSEAPRESRMEAIPGAARVVA